MFYFGPQIHLLESRTVQAQSANRNAQLCNGTGNYGNCLSCCCMTEQLYDWVIENLDKRHGQNLFG